MMYDGQNTLKTLDQILKEFKAEKKTDLKEEARIRLYRSVEYFLEYLTRMNTSLEEISERFMDRHKRSLISQKDIYGHFYSSTWYFLYFKRVSVFLHWLVKKGYMARPEFLPFRWEKFMSEMKFLMEQRRLKYVAEREPGREEFTDSHVLKVYGNSIKEFSYNNALGKRMLWTLKYVSEYAKEKSKTMLMIEESDREGVLNALYLMEKMPGYQINETTFVLYFSAVRHFYRWAFDHGYLQDKNFFCGITEKEVREYFRKRSAKAVCKSRHYTAEEILRAYEKFLAEVYKNYNEISNYSNAIQEFFRYITVRNRTFYTVDELFIEDWKTYLLNYEHKPGVYYTANYIAEKIKRVKLFFGWFHKRGYRKDCLLKGFDTVRYRKSIAGICAAKNHAKVLDFKIPESFKKVYEGASAFEKTLNRSPATLKDHQRGWYFFFLYLEKIHIREMREVDELVLNDYQIYLENFKKDDREPLSLNVRCRYLIAVKLLFYYLARFRFVERDPSMAIMLPKNPRGLPTAGMNTQEVQKVLEMPKGDDSLSIRNRAVLETLYSSGVRRNELLMLKVRDVDLTAGVVRINHPKGGAGFQRVVPVGKIACEWIARYMKESRPEFLKGGKSSEWLFLNQYGGRLSGGGILRVVKTYAVKSGFRNNRIVTHSFRVTCATGMLKGKGNELKGADIKWVQQQLGHTSIQSTEKYLRLVPSELKKIHSRHHPRERKQIRE